MVIEKFVLTHKMVTLLAEAHGIDTSNEEIMNDLDNTFALLLENEWMKVLTKAGNEAIESIKEKYEK